jgi:hypothetical protein
MNPSDKADDQTALYLYAIPPRHSRYALLVSLYLGAAFDTINHGIVLNLLKSTFVISELLYHGSPDIF